MKPALAHGSAIGAALLALVAVSAGWIVFLRAGPKLDAFSAGPMVVMVPLALLILTALWILARAIAPRRINWPAHWVILVSATSAYLIVAMTCGPVACFQQGSNRAMGWFIVGGVALAALVHHLALARLK